MFELVKSIKYSSRYNKIIYPVIQQRISEYSAYTRRIRKPSIRSMALEALEKNRFDGAVSAVCTLCPQIDISSAADVMFSFQAIIRYLSTICIRSSNNTEPFLKLIYASLKDAANLRTEAFEQYFTFFPSKNDDGYLSILVEKCRQKVRLLPSFEIIRDHLAAFLTLFIDLQVVKYSPDEDAREVNLNNWSTAHGKKYSDLSDCEFCMAADSPLALLMLLALATEPGLTEQKAENFSKALFPWMCGIQKILEGYANFNKEVFSGTGNNNFYYENLKEYENRIKFFINKIFGLKGINSKHFRTMVKMLLCIYTTHPKAEEGMGRITGKALVQSGGRGMFFYLSSVKLLRARKYF